MKTTNRIFFLLTVQMLIAACASVVPKPPPPSPVHLRADEERSTADIPPIVEQAPFLPPPQPEEPMEKYTVVVNEVPVKEILFALGRDASMNIDIDPKIDGLVTLNAVDQTLPQILDRISRQVNIRYELRDRTIIVSPDAPYLRTYRVDYINMARDTKDTISVATQLATTGTANVAEGGSGGGGSSGGGLNNSTTTVTSTSNHRFWETLAQNIKSMIGDKGGTAGGDTFSSENVILSPENGIITVRATSHQHEQIQEFLDSVIANAQRQVLIEATIVEVELSDQYQAGIDWNIIRGNFRGSVNRGQSNDAGEVTQLLENIFSSDNSPLTSLALTYASSGVSAMLKLLRNFGDLRVLSSPRLMVLNNHTAVLKVVENVVYFEVDAEPGSVGTFVGTGGGGQPSINNVAVDTTAKTVPVGLVMTVTPEINERDVVILNVRPTISSISRTVRDPNPLLSSIQNLVPQIQVREMESMLRINSGQTAILGGLIQDAVRKDTNSIPLLSEVPVVGDTVFKSRQTDYGKNELVIFLRPVVVHNASIQEDLRGYRSFLEDRRY